MQYGDVVLRDSSNGHVVMFVGDKRIVHASSSHGNTATGDQEGNEILISNYSNKPYEYVLRYGNGEVEDIVSEIKRFQKWLNDSYSAGLTVDGVYGNNTKIAATKAYQQILGVTADGVFGSGSKNAVVALSDGDISHAVYIMQGMLYCKGFRPQGISGVFGAATENSVKNFQLSKGLTVDGVAGKEFMYALYN